MLSLSSPTNKYVYNLGRRDGCSDGGSGISDEHLPTSICSVFWNLLCNGDTQPDSLSVPILSTGKQTN